MPETTLLLQELTGLEKLVTVVHLYFWIHFQGLKKIWAQEPVQGKFYYLEGIFNSKIKKCIKKCKESNNISNNIEGKFDWVPGKAFFSHVSSGNVFLMQCYNILVQKFWLHFTNIS